MTTHAEMVEGVRTLVAEMDAEVDRIRSHVPPSTFLKANLANFCLDGQRYGEAADCAREVLATLRGVPGGAVQLSGAEISTLLAVVLDAADQTRAAGDDGSRAAATARATMLKDFTRLASLLSGATAVYVAGDGQVES